MSSFQLKARNKKTGKIVKATCIDGYFGGRNDGYLVGLAVLKVSDFYKKYEVVKK